MKITQILLLHPKLDGLDGPRLKQCCAMILAVGYRIRGPCVITFLHMPERGDARGRSCAPPAGASHSTTRDLIPTLD
jgi:hypothetical protein